MSFRSKCTLMLLFAAMNFYPQIATVQAAKKPEILTPAPAPKPRINGAKVFGVHAEKFTAAVRPHGVALVRLTPAEEPTARLDTCWPAFDYDGRPAQTDGSYSKAIVTGSQRETADYTAASRTMTAADGKLQIRLDGKSYKNLPAEEYAVALTNLSKTEPTGIVDDFRSLKFSVDKLDSAKAVTVNVLRGSTCKPTDFVPEAFTIESGKEQVLTTACGRSSNDYIPFIELNLDDKNGYLFAVGWTGTWKARFANTGEAVDVEVGMERTHLRLVPGETIRQPSITVLVRKNQTRREFKTLVHRFMLDNKVPRDSSGKIIRPILAVASGGGNKTPQMMADILQYCVDNKMPFDTYWVDAGWYGAPHEDELYSNCGPNWWKYVGDWRVNTTTHPTGDLLPIANAVHKAGLKFLLWFEPERMTDSAPILKTHPEYRHGQLVDYGNPKALQWIQDTICEIIAKHKIDVYRQDFNMDPGSVWRGMDAADRVGIAEAKHITGMYKFLDDMRARFPDILQENCSSGGRRIDIEMISRAHTYCRSDYYIGRKPGASAFILGQNATLNLMPYLPFQGCEFNCVPVGDDYAAFSIISSGTVITPSDFDGGIIRRKITDSETAWIKKVFDVAIRMRPFYMGDFYQLTDETGAGDDVWCAWQCNRPDMKAGFAIFFRRDAAAEESCTFRLGGIESDLSYQTEFYNGSKKTVTGSELKNWTVKLAPRTFQLVFYRKQLDGPNPLPTDWLKEARIGAFMHFLPGDAASFAKVNDFDVEALAKQLEEIGAKYFVFTLGQNSGWYNSPNAAYDRVTGYQPGERCSRRDLPLELYHALHARGIRLMLYLPCQTPNRDTRAQRAFGLKQGPQDQPIDIAFARRWAEVIHEWSARYGAKVSGWWFDGGYARVGFNEDIARIYADAVKRGNPQAIVTFNPGVRLIRHTQAEDYTAGELNDPFAVVPTARWVDSSQWHALTFLGSTWGRRDVRQPTDRWREWFQKVAAHEGAVTLDIGPNWDLKAGPIGAIAPAQAEQFKEIARP